MKNLPLAVLSLTIISEGNTDVFNSGGTNAVEHIKINS